MTAREENDLFARLERQGAVIEGIRRILDEALTDRGEKALAADCLAVAQEITGASIGFIGAITPSPDRFDEFLLSEAGWASFGQGDPVVAIATLPGGIKIGGGDALALQAARSFITSDPANVGMPLGNQPVHSFLGVPFKREDRAVGLIGLANRDGDFRAEDVIAIEMLVPAAQQALETKRARAALRESERRQISLLDDLQHGVRNMLAIVRSIVRRSAGGAITVDDYAQHLEGRIHAVARTQAMLMLSPVARIDVAGLILDELSAQSAQQSQYAIDGPDIQLSAKASEVLTLAIHELATNATKYGAFASPHARLSICWAVAPRDGVDWLQLSWTESGVGIVDKPIRTGFGTDLITNRIPYELRGKGTIELRPQGLYATIDFPLRDHENILQADVDRPRGMPQGGLP